MKWSYDHEMKQVEAWGKQVVIGEIGWPGAGGRETSVENEKLNFGVTNAWAVGKNPLNKPDEAFWFEMFDEPWKTEEGPWGPHWGLGRDREQARRQSSHFPFAKQDELTTFRRTSGSGVFALWTSIADSIDLRPCRKTISYQLSP